MDLPLIPPVDLDVRWGDMDAFQHVNNTVYLRWCESARLVFFETTGLIRSQKETGIGPILASIQCRFRSPVLYPDTIQVRTYLTRLGDQDFELRHELYSQAQNKRVAEVQERGVIFDYHRQMKADFPADIKAQFERFKM